MVINHPNSIATHRRMRMTAELGQADGLGGRMFDSLRQMFCGLHGHDALLHFEHQRISLRCASCGHDIYDFSDDGCHECCHELQARIEGLYE